MGPSVSSVALREPTLIAQAAATLDELTGGRTEVVLSSGNFGLLSQYGLDWKKMKPLSRTIEGVHVVRTLPDDGAITFDGDFFHYEGLFTFARPVQSSPGACPRQDGCDAWASLLRGLGRVLGRMPSRVELHPRGV